MCQHYKFYDSVWMNRYKRFDYFCYFEIAEISFGLGFHLGLPVQSEINYFFKSKAFKQLSTPDICSKSFTRTPFLKAWTAALDEETGNVLKTYSNLPSREGEVREPFSSHDSKQLVCFPPATFDTAHILPLCRW